MAESVAEILDILNKNPVFFLATAEGSTPYVRGMLLYRADREGIVFHTGSGKDVCGQMIKNPNVELCFYNEAKGVQIRVRGAIEKLDDRALKDEIVNHPSREFLKAMRAQCPTEEAFYDMITVFRLKNGIANVWTFDRNMAQKEDIAL
jgi:uncharacterized pyridoxamine 5'-phosphate oxidase family protein